MASNILCDALLVQLAVSEGRSQGQELGACLLVIAEVREQ